MFMNEVVLCEVCDAGSRNVLANAAPGHKKSDPLPSRFSRLGGRFLAVVVLQFTARCSQHRFIERHSQLGKTLEFLDGDVSE